jgi:hypothetical protein
MEKVKINRRGIIDNILQLKYTITENILEYINNIIEKNSNQPDYSINISNKITKDKENMLILSDNNSLGFDSFKEMKDAYEIANSKKTGANNKGIGIFSPICIDDKKNSVGLFIQDTYNGKFITNVKYYSIDKTIFIKCRTFDEFCGGDENMLDLVNQLKTKDGTISYWLNTKQSFQAKSNKFLLNEILKKNEEEDKEKIDFLKYYSDIQKNKIKIKNKIQKHESHIDIINKLRYYYFEYINKDNITIQYNSTQINPLNIMNDTDKTDLEFNESRDEDDEVFKELKFNIEAQNKNYTIQKEKDDLRYKFKQSGDGFGKSVEIFRPTRENPIESCSIQVTDNQENKRGNSDKRKIYIEVNKIIIAEQLFQMNGCWPNLRIKVICENRYDNTISKFVNLDNNKSKSRLNVVFEKMVTTLIKNNVKKLWGGKGKQNFLQKIVNSKLNSNPFCAITKVLLNNTLGVRFERNYEDDDTSNNSEDNLELLNANVHLIKTNDRVKFDSMRTDPKMVMYYNLVQAIEHIEACEHIEGLENTVISDEEFQEKFGEEYNIEDKMERMKRLLVKYDSGHGVGGGF